MLKAKEQAFCYYYHQLCNAKEAAVKAGYLAALAESTAMRLLQRREVQEELERLAQKQQKEQGKQRILQGLHRLAFGGVNDVMRLVFDPERAPSPEEGDFFAVSELKRPKEGAVEVKFFDRFKAMQLLWEWYGKGEDEAHRQDFYEALEHSAAKLSGCEADA